MDGRMEGQRFADEIGNPIRNSIVMRREGNKWLVGFTTIPYMMYQSVGYVLEK